MIATLTLHLRQKRCEARIDDSKKGGVQGKCPKAWARKMNIELWPKYSLDAKVPVLSAQCKGPVKPNPK